MDDQKEEALRNEAINQRLAGERRCDICRALGRSTAWFDKWWARYRRYGRVGLRSRSRAPEHVHNKMRLEIEEAIVRIRKVLEERSDPELKYAFIGAPTIRSELKRTPLRPLPSVRAVARALQRRELTRPRRKRKHPNEPTAYCPLPVVRNPNDVHALDIVIRHLLGGERICSFHLLDLASRYPVLRQYADKSAVSTKSLLVAAWQTVGLPNLLQIDNEATFCGGYRHKRIFSQVVRLCLTVGVEVMFIPFYSPQKNADIESFNSDWDLAFWQRERFQDLAHVRKECRIFERWYRTRHEPPALEGLTPAEARADFAPRLLSTDFDLHLAEKRLPLTSGRVHFLRLVDSLGQINLLNESWIVEEEAEELVGEYVWVTISTVEQRLRIYHQKAADAARRLVVEYDYEITEEVQEFAPAYCPDGKVDASTDC